MSTRNRLSMAGTGGSALLESLDAFKRKHVSQNKEIIHRNSELMKLNSDLNKRVREMQQELMNLKGDNLRLNGHVIQQEIQLAHVTEMLALERNRNEDLENRQSCLNPAQTEAVSQALAIIISQAQQASSFVQLPRVQDQRPPLRSYGSVSTSSLASYTSESSNSTLLLHHIQQASVPSSGSLQNQALLQAPRATFVMEPDLSLIDEGSLEVGDDTVTGEHVLETEETPHPSEAVSNSSLSRLLVPSPSPSPSPLIADLLSNHSNSSNISTRRKSNAVRSLDSLANSSVTSSDPTLPAPMLPHSSPSSFNLPRSTSEQSISAKPSNAALRALSIDDLADSMEASATISERKKRFRPKQSCAPHSEAVTEKSVKDISEQSADGRLPRGTYEPPINLLEDESTPPMTNLITQRKRRSSALRQNYSELDGDDSVATVDKPASFSSLKKPRPAIEVSKKMAREPLANLGQNMPVDEMPASKVASPVKVMEIVQEETHVENTSKKRRSVSQTGHEETSEAVNEDENEPVLQEGRRARKSVNYALPSLRAKMRQPEGYIPSIKKAARHSHSVTHLQNASRVQDTDP